MNTKRCPRCLGFFPLTQFGINKSARDGLSYYCMSCQRGARLMSDAKLEKEDPGHKARLQRALRLKKPGSTYTESRKAYVRANREKHRAWVAASTAKFKAEFPEEYATNNGEKVQRRAAAKIQRTPAWSSPESCRVVYRLRESIQKTTRVRHAVDHSVPLRGRLVSGLHVAENLIVITHEENGIKGNRFDPMTYEWWPECCPKPPTIGTLPTSVGH
jgi:hypothetical protein